MVDDVKSEGWLPVVLKPYETVLFGMQQGLLNSAQAWLEIPILLPMFFQMDIDTGARPGGL